MARFDRKTWQRFFKIVKPFFISELKWKARVLLIMLAVFSISINGLNLLMSYVSRDFMTALTLKEKSEFFHHLYRYLGMFALATPVIVFYQFTEQRFGLIWRRWLTQKVLVMYFSNRSYYRITMDERIDNPDQRIEEDIRTFTSLSLSFYIILFNSFITLCTFIHVLWTISIPLTVVALIYPLVGTCATYFLGRPLIGLNFEQLKREADFRYKLVNVRDNAESIAFYRGERQEATRVRQRLSKALDNFRLIINWNRNLGFFTTGYNYVLGILPTLVVAPLYFDSKIEFGVVTQAGIAFGNVLGALSIIVARFGDLSNFAAVVTRLGTFWEVLNEDAQPVLPGKEIELLDQSLEPSIKLENVTIITPHRDRVLAQDLSLLIASGQSLLITGASGSGKSSILRVIAGLWEVGSGHIARPRLERTIFLPQRPYVVLGSLRSQFVYSVQRKGISDRDLHQVVSAVQLDRTVERVGGFDAKLDWSSILSTGEQQRLAFARLMLAKPECAFLDEATTALDAQDEAYLYELLRSMTKIHVSIGHRTTLARFHDWALELSGNGKWRLDSLKESSK